MKATTILSKLAKEVCAMFETADDFCGWATTSSNIEVIHDNKAYCVDFTIKGFKAIDSKLTVMRPVIVEGKTEWVSTFTDKTTSEFYEKSISSLIALRFDEIIEQFSIEAARQDEAIQDEIEMLETYKSLSVSER